MTRIVALACCAAVFAAMAVEASADRRADVDRRTGFAFELDGTSLTVSIRPGQRAEEAREQVFGEFVTVVCFSSYDSRLRSRVLARLTWPAGQDALTFTLGRDISRRAKLCLLEDDGGGDIADVSFGPDPAELLVQTRYVNGPDRRGARSFLRLRDDGGRTALFGRGRTLGGLAEPGRYRLIRYERRCLLTCRVLGRPTLRCARPLQLPTRRTRVALVVVDAKRRTCRIEVVRELATTDGERKAPLGAPSTGARASPAT